MHAGIDWDAIPTAEEAGVEMHALMRELYPICRSLSGDGVRATLDRLERYIPLERTEVASGTKVFDWTLPKEWNIQGAWIAGRSGERIVDFEHSNLHVLGYSVPVCARVPVAELRKHVFTLPEHPQRIPYRTSYYNENWGFCLAHDELEQLSEAEYEICIDATLEPGHITYAESSLPGATAGEVLISTYLCHPSLCNDNLSGVVLVTLLAKYLQGQKLRYTYRFLLSPGTIGPLLWLSRNERAAHAIRHGLVASCVGDPGGLTYKKSRRGNAEIDRAVEHVLRESGNPFEIREFTPLGGDERQFCSPGFNLPVGALSRTPADEFPEYHSSADNLEFVRPDSLGDSFRTYLNVLDVLETNMTFINLNPKGEPQLGKRGLYRAIGGGSFAETALLWVLNLSDGENSLLDISDRAGIPFAEVRRAACALLRVGLLQETAAATG